MTSPTKNLIFKGIEKKEQILFKSFLNLAKNELEFQIAVLKDSDTSGTKPDIVIVDASYQFPESEAELARLPAIVIGRDASIEQAGYIARPVQWSDFKIEFSRLDLDSEREVPSADTDERVLPQEMRFVIAEMDDRSEDTEVEEEKDEYNAEEDYDYELGNLSVDYHSFTNSEYLKVVEDVQGFKDAAAPEEEDNEDPVTEADPLQQPVILVTDDESASANSVLVIETDSLDAWDMSVVEMEEGARIRTDKLSGNEDSADADDTDAEAELKRILASGMPVATGEPFWSTEAEIYSETTPLFIIKPERDMVYSDREPARWTAALRNKSLTKVKLADGWRPSDAVKAYPISRLVWANTLATQNTELAEGLDANEEYILERWPHFDLLELDNMLLKLCTMLFVEAQSPYNLMQKTGYSRSVVYGMINACDEMGILRKKDEVDVEKFSEMQGNDDSVFGKIKDVFR